MNQKLKLKKSVKIKIVIFVFLIVISITSVKLYKDYLYKQTYEYKLLEINYGLDEIKVLTDNLEDKRLDQLLLEEYNPDLTKLITEKYYLAKNLDRYLEYKKENDINLTDVVTLVNVNRDQDFYENPAKADYEKEELMLVNKYYHLDKDYSARDIVTTSGTYSYANNSLNEEAYSAFKNLAEDAKVAGYTILIVSSYRDYNYQDEIWTNRKNLYGTKKADEYAARPGHSEHQTGYAIDVADYYDVNDKFGETDSYLWMKNNAHRYGFILRYPKDKENITGYAYEPWHYRYVGSDIATKIFSEKITFDEYYAYYLDS